MEDVECVVIGAGVIGIAAARALAMAGREVVVLEKSPAIGMGASSRNSEVIHAGIYYPADSLKARFCVEGRARLYAYCAERGIPHRRCGKFIVAVTEAQVDELDAIAERARRNGVGDIETLSGAQAMAAEPALKCLGALHSPSTGIIDSHAYMLHLLGDAQAHGAMVAFCTAAESMRVEPGAVAITISGDDTPMLRARVVINAAGIDAAALTHRIDGLDPAYARNSCYAKGSYFSLSGRAPFTRLIYPAPEPGGLGVHLTLDLAGQARFGPDVEWVDAPSYHVDPKRAETFYAAIRAYWPDLRDGALAPAYAGVRAKLHGQDRPNGDFAIEGPDAHGAAGVINLLGIESPGLTSSLAIADHVAEMARECLDA
ncbi:MAG: NAD(P)/FAD-dependent oxidoreductase [Hydrogenophilaceae bacterium]|nr:NAD(P)/FAD-dependent oxidoreductase [Hydrogenophilaceae bacterium]